MTDVNKRGIKIKYGEYVNDKNILTYVTITRNNNIKKLLSVTICLTHRTTC